MGAFLCARGDPEAKGLVERANRYLETSFLPGRSFTSSDDFNVQLGEWLETKANRRIHRTTRARPIDLVAEDRAAMRPLPPVLPDVSWRGAVRLGRDHYLRFDTCDYSVHPRSIGSWVDIVADGGWVGATTPDGSRWPPPPLPSKTPGHLRPGPRSCRRPVAPSLPGGPLPDRNKSRDP